MARLTLTKSDGKPLTIYFNDQAIEERILEVECKTVKIELDKEEMDALASEFNAKYEDKYGPNAIVMDAVASSVYSDKIWRFDCSSNGVSMIDYETAFPRPFQIKAEGARIHLSNDKSYDVLQVIEEINEALYAKSNKDLHALDGKDRAEEYFSHARNIVRDKINKTVTFTPNTPDHP